MNALPDFTFSVAGEGITIDPATGTLTIATEALMAGVGVVLTARDATGAPTSAFRVTVRIGDGDVVVAPAEAPELLAAPGLAGAGLIGVELGLDPGRWSGAPAPEIAVQWRRDGVDIPGATGLAYVPVALDDGAMLSAHVTARNDAGVAEAETGAIGITHVAPSVVGGLADLALTQGPGAHRVETAGAFAGAALGFSVMGGEGVIDPVTGALDLPLGSPRADETVTVTARNSGGAAARSFRLTILAAPAAPVAIGAIGDLAYPLGAETRSVSTQAHFEGEDLVYALEAAPAGVTIQPGSGLVTITTAEAIDGVVSVRAENAGGVARQSFRVTVRSMSTVFAEAGALADMGFLSAGAAPSWTLSGGSGRLVPAADAAAHGIWSKAGGDGRYRVLARWTAPNSNTGGNEPITLGARLGLAGGNFTGVLVEAFRPAGTSPKQLRILEYTGAGAATVERAQVVQGWVWGNWYWLEAEIAGDKVRARLYPEAEAAPRWQIEATVAAPAGSGGFGFGAIPLAGVSRRSS